MLSLQKHFLFIHVPKTAGNSIQNILKKYSDDKIVTFTKYQDGIERFEVLNSKFKTTKHSPLSHYKSAMDSNIYRSLYKFAVIRNPWDRMISHYFSPGEGMEKKWKRAEFLELVNTVPAIPQYIRVPSMMEKLVTYFGMGKIKYSKKLDADIDFLMKFEQLNRDFKLVCKHLDIPYSPLPKRNQSRREHYTNYYDDELREIVRTKFKEEIEFGNYSFKSERKPGQKPLGRS